MALFSKRLTCFYCGRRSHQPVQSLNSTVRKFHCENCEADNYLDQVRYLDSREITPGLPQSQQLTTFCRTEISQTPRPRKRIPSLMAPTRKALASNRLALKNPTCFVPDAFATNICLPTPWQHTKHPPTTHLSTMKTTTPSTAGVWKTGIRQFATTASHACDSELSRPGMRRRQITSGA